MQKQTFRQVSEIFENLRKSSEIFRKNWKMSQSASRRPSSILKFFNEIFGSFRKSWQFFGCLRKISEICRKVLKITFQHLNFFLNVRKLSEVFGKNRKMLESSQNDLPTLFENFREIFGSVRKCSENFGNPRKFFKCNRRFMKIFYTVPISDTCGLKIRFKNFDL